MDLIESFDTNRVKELFSKNWLTHDAMWYGGCVPELGKDRANKLNPNTLRARMKKPGIQTNRKSTG